MRSTRSFLVTVLFAACLVPTEDHSIGSGTNGGGTGAGLGGAGGGGGETGFERCALFEGFGVVCTTVFPVVCAGVCKVCGCDGAPTRRPRRPPSLG